MTRATILIPAHNEAPVIERCLRSLLEDADSDEFEVIVLSNGSTDQTVELARGAALRLDAGSSVTVLDIALPGKAAAINQGLDSGCGPKCIVLDADVLVDAETARELCRSLDQSNILAASTTVDFDFGGVSWPSRSYHRFWKQLPSVSNGLAGRGVYGFNARGIERVGRLPLVIADDRFVDLAFGVSERTIVGGSSTVIPSRGLRELIGRKSRVFLGNDRLKTDNIPSFNPDDRPTGGWFSALRSNPASVIDLPIYLAVNLLAKAKAKARRMAGDAPTIAWTEDRSRTGDEFHP